MNVQCLISFPWINFRRKETVKRFSFNARRWEIFSIWKRSPCAEFFLASNRMENSRRNFTSSVCATLSEWRKSEKNNYFYIGKQENFAMCEGRLLFPATIFATSMAKAKRRRETGNRASCFGWKIKEIFIVRPIPSGLVFSRKWNWSSVAFWGHARVAYMWLFRWRAFAPGSLRFFRLTTVELERFLDGRRTGRLLTSFPVEVDDQVPDRGRLRARRWQDVQHLY